MNTDSGSNSLVYELSKSKMTNHEKFDNPYPETKTKSQNHEAKNGVMSTNIKPHLLASPKNSQKLEYEYSDNIGMKQVNLPNPNETPFSKYIKELSFAGSPNPSLMKNWARNRPIFLKYDTPPRLDLNIFADLIEWSSINKPNTQIERGDYSGTNSNSNDIDQENIEQQDHEHLVELDDKGSLNYIYSLNFPSEKPINVRPTPKTEGIIPNDLIHTRKKDIVQYLNPNELQVFNTQNFSDINTEPDTIEKVKPNQYHSSIVSTPINCTKLIPRKLFTSFNAEQSDHDHDDNKSHMIEEANNVSTIPFNSSKKNNEDVKSDNNINSPNQIKKHVNCKCKKSKCLKLYCDCFAAGEYCRDCNCDKCENLESNIMEREKAILATLGKNPLAFKPKVDKVTDVINQDIPGTSDQNRHVKGCNCKKSGCLKKYCECYQGNVKCTELCKCENCKNTDLPSGVNKSEYDNHIVSSNPQDTHSLEKFERNHNNEISSSNAVYNNDKLEYEMNDDNNEESSKNFGKFKISQHNKKQKHIDEKYNILGLSTIKKQKVEKTNLLSISNNSADDFMDKDHDQIKIQKNIIMNNDTISQTKPDQKTHYNTRRKPINIMNSLGGIFSGIEKQTKITKRVLQSDLHQKIQNFEKKIKMENISLPKIIFEEYTQICT